MCDNEAYTDVVELCALLQCLGFSVKSLEANDGNTSHDGGHRTIDINCQTSGLHVVLESASMPCFCPALSQQNSGMWQVSAVSGGKHLDKEFGCTLLGSLPKAHRERLTMELREIIRCIKQNNESVGCDHRREDKSASVTDLKTPEKLLQELEVETPTRYRSLDTLTSKSKITEDLPAPGALTRTRLPSACDDGGGGHSPKMPTRQGTYMLSSTPGGSGTASRRKNKTSSPIQFSKPSIMDTLIAAQKAMEDIHNKISSAIQWMNEECREDSSMSSLALDVSKISLLKAENSKAQFASSPNLTGLAGPEDVTKSRLRRFDSASTSNLDQRSGLKESKLARLRRISPNIFKKDASMKSDKDKTQDGKGKLRSLLRPKIVTPVRLQSPVTGEPSPNRSRNKYSHIKSTIPRPAKKD